MRFSNVVGEPARATHGHALGTLGVQASQLDTVSVGNEKPVALAAMERHGHRTAAPISPMVAGSRRVGRLDAAPTIESAPRPPPRRLLLRRSKRHEPACHARDTKKAWNKRPPRHVSSARGHVLDAILPFPAACASKGDRK
jgi:hypothetical protein